ncbi:MAG: DUF2254 domain-containing protein [Chitinophagaceae bacterium]|nr:DUF2254 domain-containing protein [Chitinophagaceae bacterium]MCB9046272.1 DUF2254 domain-containing protein [Chitinophagales bacterium]
MVGKFLKWIRQHYLAIINSIAFYPAIIAFCFLLGAIGLFFFDHSDIGHSIKDLTPWLTLKDPGTARTILATIAAGILSLSVFSFSMVMILLNQAAVNMSNRILDMMIGNRFHQVILGFYIGTIVFAFFLLSTIRDAITEVPIPSLSIYSLIILTITDIFLFIYFLHYITQSVKYETIIARITDNTRKAFAEYYVNEREPTHDDTLFTGQTLYARKSGYYQGFAEKRLLDYATEHNCRISIMHPSGTYLVAGTAVAAIEATGELDATHLQPIADAIDIFAQKNNMPLHPYLGCTQLSEIAVKALSPGINDPGTAILSLNALAELLSFCLHKEPVMHYKDSDETVRITTREYEFKDYINGCIMPIWDYGKDDRMIQQAFKNVLIQLQNISRHEADVKMIQKLLNIVNSAIEEQKQ